jgi:hypothetical protein
MRRIVMVVSAVLIAPTLAEAQERTWGLDIIPRFGFFHADKSMGLLAPGQVGSPLMRMQNSVAFGAAVQLETPLRWLAIRGVAEQTIGADLTQRGRFDPSEVDLTEPRDQSLQAGTSVMNLAGSVLVRPFPNKLPLYFVGGVGLKRYDFGRGGWSEDGRYRYGGREGALSVHAGLGTEIDLGGPRFVLEAATYTSGFRGSIDLNRSVPDYYRSLVQRALHDRLGHDLFVTVGVKVPVFGEVGG